MWLIGLNIKRKGVKGSNYKVFRVRNSAFLTLGSALPTQTVSSSLLRTALTVQLVSAAAPMRSQLAGKEGFA